MILPNMKPLTRLYLVYLIIVTIDKGVVKLSALVMKHSQRIPNFTSLRPIH